MIQTNSLVIFVWVLMKSWGCVEKRSDVSLDQKKNVVMLEYFACV